MLREGGTLGILSDLNTQTREGVFVPFFGKLACTTAGMKEPEMAEIGALIGRALRGRSDESELAAVREAAAVLCSKFTPYP